MYPAAICLLDWQSHTREIYRTTPLLTCDFCHGGKRVKSTITLMASGALLLSVGLAEAKVIKGTNGPNKLKGTTTADTIYGTGGDDVIHGNAGNDLISGGL